jgi:non-canonical purine NTP pyrophosphatase (RdgB/HAM1 family)
MKPKKLLLATGNAGKIKELRKMLSVLPLDLLSLRDFDCVDDVDETGSTFEENAWLKARGFALQTKVMSLADDSGLEVEALGNSPGVYSARFAGEDTDYEMKIQKLLSMLDSTCDKARRARFVCVMSLADPDGKVFFTARGVCPGTIATSPRGDNGFGYDPIFMPDGFEQTFGELDDSLKRVISHRARAAELIIRYLLDFIAV